MTHQSTRTLRRSKNNRVVAGICGGLEEFFGISAFWFRLAFLLILIPGGLSPIIYFIMWVVIPSEE